MTTVTLEAIEAAHKQVEAMIAAFMAGYYLGE